MKNWVRQHPYRALACGYVIFLLFAASVQFVVVSRDPVDAVASAFITSSIYGLFALVQLSSVRKTQKRLAERGQFRAFVRYPDSRPGSLSGIWNQGIATPGTRSLRFQPAVYDSLEPSGQPTDFVVHGMLPDRRKVRGKERKYLPSPGFHATTLLTDRGRVQLAASPASLDGIAEALGAGPAR